jgi:hypothetical protein
MEALMGKSSINGPFSMAMLNNQRVRELSGGEGQLLKNNMLNILKRFEQESKVLKYRTVN